MSEDTGWDDLAKMWQADAAAISAADIDEHLRRQRRQMLGVMAAQLSGLLAGFIAAICVLVSTHPGMGVAILIFGGASALITLRMRRESEAGGSMDLLQSLKDSIAREDWLAEQLRLGRALSFVALFAIVLATAVQLLKLKAFSAAGLTAAGIGCGVVLAALVWNLVLTLRSRRRKARLRYIEEKLRS